MSAPIFATPEDAETAFYEALENADLDAMMEVWADDEDVVCIHPAGPRLSGLNRVRDSWRQIFDGGRGLRFHLTGQQYLRGVRVAIHSLHENILVAGEPRPRGPIIATNVYIETERGWRMIVHHASPAPRKAPAESEAPPSVLH